MQSKRRVSTVEQRAKFREKKPRKGTARGGGSWHDTRCASSTNNSPR